MCLRSPTNHPHMCCLLTVVKPITIFIFKAKEKDPRMQLCVPQMSFIHQRVIKHKSPLCSTHYSTILYEWNLDCKTPSFVCNGASKHWITNVQSQVILVTVVCKVAHVTRQINIQCQYTYHNEGSAQKCDSWRNTCWALYISNCETQFHSKGRMSATIF